MFIVHPYDDKTRDIQSNIALCLREFTRARPDRTPKGRGPYLTVYPESRPNTDSKIFLRIIILMIPSIIPSTIRQYTPRGVYCEKYPSLKRARNLNFRDNV